MNVVEDIAMAARVGFFLALGARLGWEIAGVAIAIVRGTIARARGPRP